MAYDPENNPHIPGDPASYDLKWVIDRLNEHKFAEESAAEAKIQADRAENEADRAKNQADRAAGFADDASGYADNAENALAGVQNDLATQEAAIAVLETRMDSFTHLAEGSTTGDAELIDARIGYNGVNYPVAGDAIRGQVSDIHDVLEEYTSTEFFRYERGALNNSDGVFTLNYARCRFGRTVILQKGDRIKTLDNNVEFGLAIYDYLNNGAYVANSYATHAWLTEYVIEETNMYVIVCRFTDDHSMSADEATAMTNKVVLYRKYGSRKDFNKYGAIRTISEQMLIPYCSLGGSNATADLNQFGNRTACVRIPTTGPIFIKNTNPNYKVNYRTCDDPNVRTASAATSWKSTQIINAPGKWIECVFGRTDDATLTNADMTAIAAAFTIIEPISNVLNVKAFGAVGDGVTDDTYVLQNILDMCNTIGGGTIFVPIGTYLISSQLIFYSNTHIIFEGGATIVRGAEINGVFYSHCTDNTLSYNGVQNVIIEGGIIDLGTGITQGGLAIGIIHGNNITIRNMVFKHVNAGYHCCDICCSKNVTIENCVFEDLLTNSDYGECVQIDAAVARVSFPSPELSNGAATFDGTPTENVEIHGCRFILNNYSPAIGNHNAIANKNIFIHDNVIKGTGSGATRGAIVFADYDTPNATTQVMIYFNIFEDCNNVFKIGTDNTGHLYARNNLFKNVNNIQINPLATALELSDNISIA